MSDTLNTLIAFAVVIIGLSTLLQLVIAALKDLLNIRGVGYRRFLVGLYGELVAMKNSDAKTKAKEGVISGHVSSIPGRLKRFQKQVDELNNNWAKITTLVTKAKKALDTSNKTDTEKLKAFAKVFDGNLEMTAQLKLVRDVFSMYSLISNTRFEDNDWKEFGKLDKLISDARTNANGVTVKTLRDLVTKIETYLANMKSKVVELKSRLDLDIDSLIDEARSRYQTTAKQYAFWFGLAICLVLNADAIRVYKVLNSSPQVRQAVEQNIATLTNQPRAFQISKYANPIFDASAAIDKLITTQLSISQTDASAITNAAAVLHAKYQGLTNSYGTNIAGITSMVRASEIPVSLDAGSVIKIFQSGKKLAALSTGKEPGQFHSVLKDVRTELKAAETDFARDTLPLNAKLIQKQARAIAQMGLPLMWSWDEWRTDSSLCLVILFKILGILAMAILISFGSGFWQDVLQVLLGARKKLQT